MNKKEKNKFVNCDLPVYDYVNNIYVYSDGEDVYEAADLEMAYEEYIRYCCTYRYHTLVYRYDDKGNIIDKVIDNCHGHSFNDVLNAVQNNPYDFYISDDEKEDYSQQQLEFIKRLKSFLIDIKYDISNKLNISDKLDELYDQLEQYDENSDEASKIQRYIDNLYTEKEIANSKNELAKKYLGMHCLEIDNDERFKNILEDRIHYLIRPANLEYYKSREGEKILLRDKNYHIVAILKIVRDEVIKIDELKLKDIPYNLEGFKTLEERIDSFNQKIEPCENYDGHISYMEFVIDEKL